MGRPAPVKTLMVLALAWALLLPGMARATPGSEGETLTVSPAGPYTSVQAAVDAAPTGAVVQVLPGVYRERVVIDRPIHLAGEAGAVIDGGGEGTILTVLADGTVVEGLVLRDSGRDLTREDSGITVMARDVTIIESRLEDVLFGFNLKEAHGAVIRGNVVEGKPLAPSRRGDGLRLWYSHDVRMEDNVIKGTRDALIWHSHDTFFARNHVLGGRYGLHFMYAQDSVFLDNRFEDNTVGSYIMFTQRVVLSGNVFAGSRGAVGYGLAFKDADDSEVRENLFVGNFAGIYLDNTPSRADSRVRFERNVIAGNGVAVVWLSNVGPAIFTRNTFTANSQTVRLQSGGQDRIRWSEDGVGNYWEDYAGFDLDGDGVGDVSHQIVGYADRVTSRVPETRLLVHSPVLSALDLAEKAVPVYRTRQLVEDPAPLMVPDIPADFLAGGDPAYDLALASALMTAVVAVAAWRLAPGRFRLPRREVQKP